MPKKEAVTVKSYGLVRLTKKTYVTIQAVGFLILALVFVATFFTDIDKYLFGNARVVVLVVAFLEILETYFMLRRFNRKERQSL